MPKLDLTFSIGALSAAARQELPAQLAAALLRWEGAPDTGFFRSIAWVHLHELAEGATHDADGDAADSHFVLDVTIPHGALSERRRAGFIGEATELIVAAAGLAAADAMRQVWIVVHEIPDGRWGAGGEVVDLARLKGLAAREQQRVTATG